MKLNSLGIIAMFIGFEFCGFSGSTHLMCFFGLSLLMLLSPDRR